MSTSNRQLQAEVGPVLDQRSLLVLLLVLEKSRGSGSFFAPYCDMLPDSYGEVLAQLLAGVFVMLMFMQACACYVLRWLLHCATLCCCQGTLAAYTSGATLDERACFKSAVAPNCLETHRRTQMTLSGGLSRTCSCCKALASTRQLHTTPPAYSSYTVGF